MWSDGCFYKGDEDLKIRGGRSGNFFYFGVRMVSMVLSVFVIKKENFREWF